MDKQIVHIVMIIQSIYKYIYKFIEKAWNSTCNESNECRTEFCNDLDKLCLCPPNTIIDGDNNSCLNVTKITGNIYSVSLYHMLR